MTRLPGLGQRRRRLQQQRRFADARIAADQHRRAVDEPAAGDAVEFGDAGLDPRRGVGHAGERHQRGRAVRGARRLRPGADAGVDGFLDDGVPLAAAFAAPGPFGRDGAAGLADIACAPLGHRDSHEFEAQRSLDRSQEQIVNLQVIPYTAMEAPVEASECSKVLSPALKTQDRFAEDLDLHARRRVHIAPQIAAFERGEDFVADRAGGIGLMSMPTCSPEQFGHVAGHRDVVAEIGDIEPQSGPSRPAPRSARYGPRTAAMPPVPRIAARQRAQQAVGIADADDREAAVARQRMGRAIADRFARPRLLAPAGPALRARPPAPSGWPGRRRRVRHKGRCPAGPSGNGIRAFDISPAELASEAGMPGNCGQHRLEQGELGAAFFVAGWSAQARWLITICGR